jgi:hypothetical protein
MEMRRSAVNAMVRGSGIGSGARVTILASCLALFVSGCFGARFEMRCGWADRDDNPAPVYVAPLQPATQAAPMAPQQQSSVIPNAPAPMYAYPQYQFGPPPSTWDTRRTTTAALVLSGLGIAAAGTRIEDPDARMSVMSIGGALTVLGGLTAISFALDEEEVSYRYSMNEEKSGAKLVLGPGSATLAYRF